MAALHPNLQEQLRRLDEELEEGDITRKGYEKRKSILLSQYRASQNAPTTQRGGLRIHSPEDSDHPASKDNSRSASLAALTAVSSTGASTNGTLAETHPGVIRQFTVVREDHLGRDGPA